MAQIILPGIKTLCVTVILYLCFFLYVFTIEFTFCYLLVLIQDNTLNLDILNLELNIDCNS